MRVISFGDQGLEEVGKFIDQGGNDFWGVEQWTIAGGERLIAGSDRNFGLYVLRYTGPGAAPVAASRLLQRERDDRGRHAGRRSR